MSEHAAVRVVALGAHVLDVLARPVTEIPEGQGGTLVEQIRLSPAGAAGGTAVTLAKLGAETFSAGAVGTDRLGDVLLAELQSHGVDTAHLLRRADVQTSASVLPIRPNGDRPALHVIGANGSYGVDDVPWDLVESAGYLHMGGPEFLGPEAPRRSWSSAASTAWSRPSTCWPMAGPSCWTCSIRSWRTSTGSCPTTTRRAA